MFVKDLARLYKDCSGAVKINWSAVGPVDLNTAGRFAKHILKLVETARKKAKK